MSLDTADAVPAETDTEIDWSRVPYESFADPDTHPVEFRESKTPFGVDGYAKGEIKWMWCPHEGCDAHALVTSDPSGPSFEDLPHERDCPARRVVSEYYVRLLFGVAER